MKLAYLMFMLTIILQPIAQILEKKGMGQVGVMDSFSKLLSFGTLFKIATNPYIITGVMCSAFGLIMWLGALSNFKVSYLFPFGSVSYIILALLAMIILGEKLALVNWAGIALIVAGCFLINVR